MFRDACACLLSCLLLALLWSPPLARALPLDTFECITENSSGDCAIGETQLTGEIVDGDLGEALLTLTNTGPERAVVARIYIESDLVWMIDGGSGESTSFSTGGSPPVLPGANKSFVIVTFSTADPAPPKNGIGPGESATFSLSLVEGVSAADLLDHLRIGVHVIAFDSGGSESFITQPVPEPQSLALLLLGTGGVWIARRLRPGRA